jgi:predicted ester cyclase
MEPIEVVRRFIGDVATDGNVSRIEDLVADGFVGEFPFLCPEPLHGVKGYQRVADITRTIFSDLTAELDAIAATGNVVITALTATGTHQAEYFGIPATHRRVSWPVVHISTVEDGKIVSDKVIIDRLVLITALGATCSARLVHLPNGIDSWAGG